MPQLRRLFSPPLHPPRIARQVVPRRRNVHDRTLPDGSRHGHRASCVQHPSGLLYASAENRPICCFVACDLGRSGTVIADAMRNQKELVRAPFWTSIDLGFGQCLSTRPKPRLR